MFTTKQRLITAALAAATLSVPTLADAKTVTFGHRLDHEPSNSTPGHNCNEDGEETLTPACTRVAIDGDQGGAVPAGMTAPFNGMITAFKVRAGEAEQIKFRVVRLRDLRRADVTTPEGEQDSRMVARGRTVGKAVTANVKGLGYAEEESAAVETFKARVKVRKGDYIAIESSKTSALYCSNGGDKHLIFSPALRGSYQQSTSTGGCELLAQAVVKKAQKRR